MNGEEADDEGERILSNICTHCEMQSFIYLDGGWDRAERETARKPQGEEAFEELMAMLITFWHFSLRSAQKRGKGGVLYANHMS